MLKQIALQEEIQSHGINLVNCGNCGQMLLHRTDVNQIECFCGMEMEGCDCPDAFYRGMEDNCESEVIEVYVNGTWDCSLEESKSVTVYDRGTVYKMSEIHYDKFINQLEENGYDCYFSPELFSHPEWNGVIEYVDSEQG